MLAACGGGDDVSKTIKDVPTQPGQAGTATETVLTAAGLLPTLDDLGFKMGSPQKIPTTNGDAVAVQYASQGTGITGIRIDLTVLPTADQARSSMNAAAGAIPNPPPGTDIPGPNTAATRPGPGDDGQSFVTQRPDQNGTLVWTDLYRFGRVFAIVYSQGKDVPNAMATRKAVAERIGAKVK